MATTCLLFGWGLLYFLCFHLLKWMRRTLGNEPCFQFSPLPPLFLTPPATAKDEEKDGKFLGPWTVYGTPPFSFLPRHEEVAGRRGQKWEMLGRSVEGCRCPAVSETGWLPCQPWQAFLMAFLAGNEKMSFFILMLTLCLHQDAGVHGHC